jgi:hypothetical protein
VTRGARTGGLAGWLRGPVTALSALAAAGGVAAAGSLVPLADPPGSPPHVLPLSRGAPALACPGPETVLVPPGARPVWPRGPVQVAVMAADLAGTAPPGTRLRVRAAAADAGAAEREDDAGEGSSHGPADEDSRTVRDGLDLALSGRDIVGGLLTASSAGAAIVESAPAARAARPPVLTGVQATLARHGDLRGLATTTCAPAAADTWLVGGGTRIGRRLRLVLTNPAATPAVADVAVHGPLGRVRAPSGEGVVVPPRSAVPVVVDALAPGLERVAVHVTARSGRVQAVLHESLLNGLAPGGTDDVPAAAPAARRQVVPGIAIGPRSEGSGAALRVVVPGTEEAVVSVRLLAPEEAPDPGRPSVTSVPGGSVVDIPLDDLPPGTYSAVLEADVPIVAGAVMHRGTSRSLPAEFGWTASAEPVAADLLVALVPGTLAYLNLVAPREDAEVTVREIMPGGYPGRRRVLNVPGHSAPGIGLHPHAVGMLVEEVTGGPVSAALVQTVEDSRGPLISVRPVVPGHVASGPEPVAVRDDRLLTPP